MFIPSTRFPGTLQLLRIDYSLSYISNTVLLLLLAYVSQISRPVEASQALVSSSRLTIPSLPDGGRCCGQTSKMWSTVCSGAPHSQTEESLRPHFSMDELNRPTPVRRRLRVVHCFRGKSRPGTLCGSRMKLCSLEGGAASQSSFQWVLYLSRHSLTQLSELGHLGDSEITKLRIDSKWDSNPGSLYSQFDVIPLNYRASHNTEAKWNRDNLRRLL